MTETLVHELIKNDRISLKDKEHILTKSKYTEEELSRMDAASEATFKLQEELGLGVPDGRGIKQAISSVKQRKILDDILLNNPSYYPVELPDEKVLPRFTRSSSGSMEEQSGTKFKAGPLLAMVKLEKGVRTIRCNGDAGKDFSAPIPLIPQAGLEKAAALKQKDENMEFHLAYMPSWEPVPQRDPLLMAKVANEYIVIHAWGGDQDVINEFVVPKN